jgi:hypothetical protein
VSEAGYELFFSPVSSLCGVCQLREGGSRADDLHGQQKLAGEAVRGIRGPVSLRPISSSMTGVSAADIVATVMQIGYEIVIMLMLSAFVTNHKMFNKYVKNSRNILEYVDFTHFTNLNFSRSPLCVYGRNWPRTADSRGGASR